MKYITVVSAAEYSGGSPNPEDWKTNAFYSLIGRGLFNHAPIVNLMAFGDAEYEIKAAEKLS